MKMRQKIIHSLVKMAGALTLTAISLMLVVTAKAECGGSLNALAASAASIQNRTKSELVSSFTSKSQSYSLKGQASEDQDQDSSIVGLWYVNFNITPPGAPGPITIQ